MIKQSLLIFLLASSSVALAGESPLVVMNSDSDGAGSLRQMIADAPADSLLTFDPSLNGEIIDLGGSELLIERNLIIDASALPDGILIDGGGDGDFVQEDGESRCIRISDGDTESDIAVTLNNLTLQNGSHDGDEGGANLNNDREDVVLRNCRIRGGRAFGGDGGADGGGISSIEGSLAMFDCSVSGNRTQGTNAFGGGIASVFGTLTMEGCSVFDNHTEGSGANGGGIFRSTAPADPATTITRCTISGNSAPNARGGGYYNFFGNTTFAHCTVINNAGSGILGGGVVATTSSFTNVAMSSSIVVGNAGGDVVVTGVTRNSFSSGGGNVIGVGNATGAFTVGGDQIEITDPLLGPLADYGGATLTHLPFADSPAIDAATISDSTIDQRGFPVVGNAPDSGAVEFRGLDVELVEIFERDIDQDGTVVGVELAIGTNPFVADAGDPRNLRISSFGSGNSPEFTFGVDDGEQQNIILRLMRSTDLINFDVEVFSNESSDFTIPFLFSDPTPPAGRVFYRLEAERRPPQ